MVKFGGSGITINFNDHINICENYNALEKITLSDEGGVASVLDIPS
jgi:hypothetical protein